MPKDENESAFVANIEALTPVAALPTICITLFTLFCNSKMNAFSIRLPENLMKEVDARAKVLRIARSEYVRLAISRMNRDVAAEDRRKRLRQVSERVRDESMQMCAEFDAVEYIRGKAR